MQCLILIMHSFCHFSTFPLQRLHLHDASEASAAPTDVKERLSCWVRLLNLEGCWASAVALGSECSLAPQNVDTKQADDMSFRGSGDIY